MVDVPMARVSATPEAFMFATELSEEVHVVEVVTSSVEPSV